MKGDEWTPVRAPSWTAAAVFASAAFALVVLVLPALGLTFLRDDWVYLDRFPGGPSAWLSPRFGHWLPLYFALFEGEYALFGANHDLFVVTTWVIHVLNLFLLARLLLAYCGDERAAALATAAFGMTSVHREVFYWVELGGLAFSATLVLGALLSYERARAGGGKWLGAVGVFTFLAPMAFSTSLAVGPVLAARAWFEETGATRRRLLASAVASWAAYVGLYLAFTANDPVARPRTPAEAGRAAALLAGLVGHGTVRGELLLPAEQTVAVGAVLSILYVVAIGFLLACLPSRRRASVLVLHGVAGIGLVLCAVARFWVEPLLEAATEPRYQYFPALAWAGALALGLARAAPRSPRRVLGGAALAVALGAFLHARTAFQDQRESGPNKRREMVTFVRELVAAVQSAKGPVYDAPLRITVEPGIHASGVVRICSPGTRAAWTTERTEESLAPYGKGTLVRAVIDASAEPR